MIVSIEMETNKTTAKNINAVNYILPLLNPRRKCDNENIGRSTGLVFHAICHPSQASLSGFLTIIHTYSCGDSFGSTEFPIKPLLVPTFVSILYIVFYDIYNLTYCVYSAQDYLQN